MTFKSNFNINYNLSFFVLFYFVKTLVGKLLSFFSIIMDHRNVFAFQKDSETTLFQMATRCHCCVADELFPCTDSSSLILKNLQGFVALSNWFHSHLIHELDVNSCPNLKWSPFLLERLFDRHWLLFSAIYLFFKYLFTPDIEGKHCSVVWQILVNYRLIKRLFFLLSEDAKYAEIMISIFFCFKGLMLYSFFLK